MKTLIAFYSRRGENYVSGDIKVLKKGNTECVVEMIKEQWLMPTCSRLIPSKHTRIVT